jgi:hypothetical protein
MISRNRLSDFSQPFATASLEDHAALQLAISQRTNVQENVLAEFFGVTSDGLVAEAMTRPWYDLPQLHRGIAKCFPRWKLVRERGGLQGYGYWWPERMSRGSGPEFIYNGSLYFETPTHGRRILSIYQHPDGDLGVVLVGREGDQDDLRSEFAAFRKYVEAGRHFLQGKVIDGKGMLLENAQKVTWDEIVLDPAILELVKRSVLDCFQQRAAFRRNRIPLRRGLLLYGPPGNGKTMIGKALARAARTTFLYVTAGDVTHACNMRFIFDLARRLRPAIVFFEDLDLYASHRDYAPSTLLGELLAQMDGLAENDGLVVMATTNDLAAIEPALKDRPSRFDVLIEIAMPSESLRAQLLAKHLARHCSAEMIGLAAARTAGASGAQIKEIAVFAIHHAIIADRLDPEGIAKPTWDDLERAIERMLGKRGQKIGFGAGVTTL